jgi:hypothetical protein
VSASRLASLGLLVALGGTSGCERCAEEPAPAPSSPPTVVKERPASSPRSAREAPRLAPVPTSPLSAEEIASCDDAENLQKRAACLGALAQRNRDPRYCDKIAEISKQATAEDPGIIKSGTAAHACLRTIAFMRDDPSLCARIGSAAMAGSCLSYFAMKRQDPEVCDLGKDSEAGHTCYLNEAARMRDPALCQKTGPFQDDCAKRLGPIGE